MAKQMSPGVAKAVAEANARNAKAAAEAEARKIAGSAEAEACPHMAVAAIADNLTYEQFQGQVTALGEDSARSKSGGVLAEIFANSPRVGPDILPAEGGALAGLNAAAIYAKRKEACRG